MIETRLTWFLVFLFAIASTPGITAGTLRAQIDDRGVKEKEIPAAALKEKLLSANRIVFLGDSITDAGHYIVELEHRLLELRSWKRGQSVINLGLSSETCCGLSEPAHPFPRPTVLSRIDRVLEKADPDVVVVCYGVNDGIYHPFSNERFARFKHGLHRLVGKIKAAGAIAIVLTPPPFDALPMSKTGKLRRASAAEFSWKQIYERYDEDVIQVYSEWIMENAVGAELAIDIGGPIRGFVAEKRKQNSLFALSADGIHMNRIGHHQMALAIAEKLDLTTVVDNDGELTNEIVELIRQRQNITHPAWVTHVGHGRPPVPPGLAINQAKQKAEEIGSKLEKLVKSTAEAVRE